MPAWPPRAFVAAGATFALGIGAAMAVVAALGRMVMWPLPFHQPDRLVQVHSVTLQSPQPRHVLLQGVATALRTSAPSLVDIAWVNGTADLPVDDAGDTVAVATVSANLLRVLGVQPIAGRDVTVTDTEGREAVLLLTFERWQRWGGTADVLGRPAANARVIGVLPRGFVLPSSEFAERLDGIRIVPGVDRLDREDRAGAIITAPIARLAPGVTLSQARADAGRVLVTLRGRVPGITGETALALTPLQEGMFLSYRPFFLFLLGGAAALLIGAAANLATLQLTRGQQRERQIAIRRALGASIGRLTSAAIAESLIICAAGTAVALLACAWMSGMIAAIVPPVLGAHVGTPFDRRTLLVAVAAALACGVVAAAMPAWQAARVDVRALLNAPRFVMRKRRTAPLWRVPLAFQAAVATVLVLACALTVQNLGRLVLTDPGVDPENVYVFTTAAGSSLPAAVRASTIARALEGLRGLQQQGSSTGFPVGLANGMLGLRSTFLGRENQPGYELGVTPGFLEALGAERLAGRMFSADESGVAILSTRAVAILFPGRSADAVIGAMIPAGKEAPRRVIGVVADMRPRAGAAALPMLFEPYASRSAPALNSFVALRFEPGVVPDPAVVSARLSAEFGTAVHVRQVIHLPETLSPWLREPRRQALLYSTIGVIGLLLAGIGLHAVASLESTRRRMEFGIRMSMGASAGDLRRLLLLAMLPEVIVGLAAGLILGWWGTRSLDALLFETAAPGLLIYASTVIVVLLAALLAGLWPARRAAQVDPADLLRV